MLLRKVGYTWQLRYMLSMCLWVNEMLIFPRFLMMLPIKATVRALGILSGEICMYGAQPILISELCKCETGLEHSSLINTAYQPSQKSKLRTISIASDGESQHGDALVCLTFKHELAQTSPIYDSLHILPLMNLQVGDNDLTMDKDYKHGFKCLCNLMLQAKGFTVHGVHLKLSVIWSHFHNNDMTLMWSNYFLNPNDWQDVKLAYDMLWEIWSLPDSGLNAQPGFFQAQKSFKMLGAFFLHIMMPYICINLSLS